MSIARARVLRWGALLAFLGLFFMHGASASAAEAHCGGSTIAGHIHSSSPDHVMTSHGDSTAAMASTTHSASPTIYIAALGVPLAPRADHLGELCVAILLAGFLILTLARVRSRFGEKLEATCDSHVAAHEARPPPSLTRSMLSIWRN